MGLGANEFVHHVYRIAPAFVGGLAVVFPDLVRVQGDDGEEYGRDAVGAAFVSYISQMADDFLGRLAHAQVIDAAHDEEGLHVEGEHVFFETVLHHFCGVTALAHVDGREIEVGHVAVGHVRRTVVEVAAALGDAVAEDAHVDMGLRAISHFLWKAPGAHRISCIGHTADPPVVGADAGALVVDIGEGGDGAPHAVLRRAEIVHVLRVLLGYFHFVLRRPRDAGVGVDRIEKGGAIAGMINLRVRRASTQGLGGASKFSRRGEGADAFPLGVDGTDAPVQIFQIAQAISIDQDFAGVNFLIVIERIFCGTIPIKIRWKAAEYFHFVAHRLRVIRPGQKQERGSGLVRRFLRGGIRHEHRRHVGFGEGDKGKKAQKGEGEKDFVFCHLLSLILRQDVK